MVTKPVITTSAVRTGRSHSLTGLPVARWLATCPRLRYPSDENSRVQVIAAATAPRPEGPRIRAVKTRLTAPASTEEMRAALVSPMLRQRSRMMGVLEQDFDPAVGDGRHRMVPAHVRD